METIYLSQYTQVAAGTFFMKSPVVYPIAQINMGSVVKRHKLQEKKGYSTKKINVEEKKKKKSSTVEETRVQRFKWAQYSQDTIGEK